MLAGILAVSAGLTATERALAAQAIMPGRTASPFTAQQQLYVRFHRLRLRATAWRGGWEQGIWVQAPRLAAEHAERAFFIRFLRAELLPYLAAARAVVYPAADQVLGGSSYARAIANGHVIEGLIDRLEIAHSWSQVRDFRELSYALGAMLEISFANDRLVIRRILARERPLAPTQRVAPQQMVAVLR